MSWITLNSVDEGYAELRVESRHIVCYFASVLQPAPEGETPKTIVYTLDGRTWSVRETPAEIKRLIRNW